jgi:hypothetical protein
MSRFTRTTRMVVASAFFVSAVVLFAATPANAVATGSMVDNGDGTMTITWATPSQGDQVALNFFASGTTCPSNSSPFGSPMYLTGTTNSMPLPPPGSSEPAVLTASPTLLSVGTTVNEWLNEEDAQITAGSYVACLYLDLAGGASQTLEITFAVAAPTTTTTTASPTTTTAAASPVTPAFTG